MIKESFVLKNKLGLHARASARMVNINNNFCSDIVFEAHGRKVNAKSLMGVMMIACGVGHTVTVTVNGEDEELAMETISEYITSGFGEDE